MFLTIIMIIVLIGNYIVLTSSANDETHEADFEWSHPLWGTWDGSIALNGLEDRDLDLTLSIHPQYFSFHLSLWFSSVGLYWRKYGDAGHCDCDRDFIRRDAVVDEIHTLLAAGMVYFNRMQGVFGRRSDQLRLTALMGSINRLCELAEINVDRSMPFTMECTESLKANFDEIGGNHEQ